LFPFLVAPTEFKEEGEDKQEKNRRLPASYKCSSSSMRSALHHDLLIGSSYKK